MKIVIDAFGGDNAPLSNIKGAADAKALYGVSVALSGDGESLKKCAAENGISLEGIDIIEAPDVFDMHTPPSEIIKSGKNSSLAVGMKYCADGNADAFVSAGSTGAIVMGGTFICKRMKGVKRAALGTMIPTKNGHTLLMDVGANADCRPEMLQQFGIMASVYLKSVHKIENPVVKLLNIGVEDTKGDELHLAAYPLLKSSPINFGGNIEARDVPEGGADAVVTDGFTGNVALKMYEGVSLTLFSIIKGLFKQSLKTKLAAVLMMKPLKGLKKTFDYSEVGGAPLLGLKSVVIKAHGSSNAKAITNAIRQAMLAVENNIVEATAADIASIEGAAKTSEDLG